MQTDIYLVRHGEPVLTKALLGSTDSPLSEYGWRQLDSAFQQLADFDALISSPLSRCAAFAQQTAERNQLPLEIQPDWRECDFGEWDGQRYQTLHQAYPQAVSEFFNDPDKFPPPAAESLHDFNQRVLQALDKLLLGHSGKKIAVLTHAGVIRSLVAWCLQMDYRSGLQFRRFAVDYASITHISIFDDGKRFPQLMQLNRLATQSVQMAPEPLENSDA